MLTLAQEYSQKHKNMNKIENTNSKIVTTSDLSAWVGPETLNAPPPHHIRNDKPLVEPDALIGQQECYMDTNS